jgi:hypothetical protein
MVAEAVLEARANLLGGDGVEVGVFEDSVYHRDVLVDERLREVVWAVSVCLGFHGRLTFGHFADRSGLAEIEVRRRESPGRTPDIKGDGRTG